MSYSVESSLTAAQSSMPAQARALVTGGAGFIGSRLVLHLRDTGRFVVRVPAKRQGDVMNGVDIMLAPDLGPNANWASVLDGVDYVVHCAGAAHGRARGFSLQQFRHVNTSGTLRLAEQAADAGVKRFVFLSSVGVHGRFAGSPFRETDPCAPREPYAVSKFEAEIGLSELAARTRMEVVIIRPPLVHGPGAPGNFGRLMRLAEGGWPLPIGRIDNRRSILGVCNLVSLIERCLVHPNAANQIFLASDGRDISTAELVRILRASRGQDPRIFSLPPQFLRVGAGALGQSRLYEKVLGSLVVDSSKVRKLLDWLPPLSLEMGLALAAGGKCPLDAQGIVDPSDGVAG